METVRYFFQLWRNKTMYANYDKWCEIQEEQFQEKEFACKNGMDPVYWCWNCKYSDCYTH